MWALLGFSLLALSACDYPRSLKARAEAVLVADRNQGMDPSTLAGAAAQISPAELSPERLRALDIRSLEVLFQALDAAHEALGRDDLLRAMTDIFTELLEHRKGHVFDFHERLFAKHVAHRDWAAIRRLYQKFPLEQFLLPDIVETPVSGPAVYEVEGGGQKLVLRAVDLSAGPRIVSVVAPGCHFSQDAIKAITADPELSRIFSALAVYIYPAHFSLDIQELARTNGAGPIRYSILRQAADWPGLDFSGTPKFYFFKDGKLVDSVDGWPSPGSIEIVRVAAAKLRS